MRLEDHNVTYLQLSGQDAELDFLHSMPEDILLRIFLAAQYDETGSIKVMLHACGMFGVRTKAPPRAIQLGCCVC